MVTGPGLGNKFPEPVSKDPVTLVPSRDVARAARMVKKTVATVIIDFFMLMIQVTAVNRICRLWCPDFIADLLTQE